MKVCSLCKVEFPIDEFKTRKAKGKVIRISWCQNCYRDKNKQYNKSKNLSAEAKENQKKARQEWEKRNAEKRRAFRKTPKQRERLNRWARERRKKDPTYRVRRSISKDIHRAIRNKGGLKNSSITNYLPYTIDELIVHLEAQFEHWMSWDNQGVYMAANWNDNDMSTWTWQMDHIIPQASLPYDSMEHENFKKCWALINLRPLSAKQNVEDGNRGVRHVAGGV